MYVSKYVETEVEFDLTPREIYNELDSEEKEELLELLSRGLNASKQYSIANKLKYKSDSEILNDKDVWDYIIRLINYEDSSLKEYIIEELTYTPPKIKQL